MKRTPWAAATLGAVCVTVLLLFVFVILAPTGDPKAQGKVIGLVWGAWMVAAILRKLGSGKDPWRFG